MRPAPRAHVFIPAGQPDINGHDYCRTCGLPQRNRRHEVTPDAGAAKEQARRLGERTG